MNYFSLIFIIFFCLSCNNINLEDKVINDLGLKKENLKTSLISSSVSPINNQETIIIIPEIENEEIDCCFELNSHILIVDTKTGNIKNKYFESTKTNGWSSDILTLSSIVIETTAYKIAENKNAFGIKVKHSSSAQASPYHDTNITLFTIHNNTLKKVLKNYDIQKYSDDRNTNCSGKKTSTEKTLTTTSSLTNGLYDIIVKTKTTTTKKNKDLQGNCTNTLGSSLTRSVLKYNGKRYKKAP